MKKKQATSKKMVKFINMNYAVMPISVMVYCVIIVAILFAIVMPLETRSPSNDEYRVTLANTFVDYETNMTVNVSFVLEEYSLVCPNFVDCDIAFPIKINLSSTYDVCPICSCSPQCVYTKSCCVTSIYAYMNVECMFFNNDETSNEGFTLSYYKVVSSCSKIYKVASELESKCLSKKTLINVPVTSTKTNLTYKNQFCAMCNNDSSFIVWNASLGFQDNIIATDIMSTVNPVEFQSMFEYWKSVNSICQIIYEPLSTAIVKPPLCRPLINPVTDEKTCNTTGYWKDYDHNIAYACKKTQLESFLKFKNVFCFLCNPGISTAELDTHALIDKCDQDTRIDVEELEKLCVFNRVSKGLLPFKNVYCRLCNGVYGYDEIRLLQNGISVLLAGSHLDITIISNISLSRLFNIGKMFSEASYPANEVLYFQTAHTFKPTFNDVRWDNCDDYRLCFQPFRIIEVDRSLANCSEVSNSPNCSKSLTSLKETSSRSVLSGTSNSKEGRPYICPLYRETDTHFTKNGWNFNNTDGLTTADTLFVYLYELFLCRNTGTDNIAFFDSCVNTHIDDSKQTEIPSLPILSNIDTTYMNISCMFCNMLNTDGRISDRVNWRYNLYCPKGLDSARFSNVNYLLKTILKHCDFSYNSPTCNDTATEDERDPTDTERDDCMDFFMFDNINCFNVIGDYHIPSYRKLFTLSMDDLESILKETESPECVNGTYDYFTDACTSLYCGQGRLLSNGTCRSYRKTGEKIMYKMKFTLSPTNILERNTHQEQTTTRPILPLINVCDNVLNTLTTNMSFDTKYELLNCEIKANMECMTDNNSVAVDRDLNILISFTFHLIYSPNLAEIEHTLVNALSSTYKLFLNAELKFEATASILLNNYTYDKGSCYIRLYDENNNNSRISRTYAYITVSKFLTCAQVEIGFNSFELNNDTSEVILLGSGRIISPDSYKRKGSSIRVCEADFRPKMNVLSVSDNHSISVIYRWFSNVCSALSLLCLFLTFLTYCRFPQLRNIPGKNNMVLAACMFCAQIFLKLGLWQLKNGRLCVIMGVCIHYFWLATFCSITVCSYHMFYVFFKNSFLTPRNRLWTFARYLTFTFGCPFVVVISTIVAHFLDSNGASTGYGRAVCFLSYLPSFIAAFLAPIGITFVLSIGFFVTTLIHLQRNSGIRSTDDRNNVYIYVKLSTIVGITWPLLVVDSMLDISIFSFFAVGVNTLQGVAIFIFFVCNKRVVGLFWKVKCRY